MKKLIGLLFLRLKGWTLYGERPSTDRYVLICAPHTSNWDFVFLVAASWSFGTRLNWLGKHTLFEGLRGRMLLAMGGVPVDRRSPQNLVDQMVDRFASGEPLRLAIPPSGTRSYRDYWKSGFYHIAQKADVPIILGLLDFKTRRVGFGPALVPSGDIGRDMDAIRAFYFGVEGKFPENQARIRLRSEDGRSEEASGASESSTAA